MTDLAIVLVTSELTCAGCLLILIWGLLSHGRINTFSSKAYFFCVVLCCFTDVMDALAYILDGKLGIDGFLTAINAFPMLDCALITAGFMYYMWTLINDRMPVSIGYAHAAAVVCGADILICGIGGIFGQFYTVKDGVFSYGPFAVVGEFIELLLVFYFLIFAILKCRKAERNILAAVIAYLTLPLISILLLVFAIDYSFIYVALSLVFLIVYVMIQADEAEKHALRERIMEETSNTDELTGLNNRRAYTAKLEELRDAAEVGVIFCDMNGLKEVNDDRGHADGDMYIVMLSKLLRNRFASDEIYRISGDEFVLLLSGITEDALNETGAELHKVFAENGNIASCGFAFGSGAELKGLIAGAEKAMYADKRDYYLTSGRDHRKR